MSSTDPEKKKECASHWKFWKTRRRVVAIMAFFGFFSVNTMRFNLSVTTSSTPSHNNTYQHNETILRDVAFPPDETFHAITASSFFYGFVCTQILGGWLGWRFGGVRVYGLAVLVTAVVTLITPAIVNNAVAYSLVVLRIIEGLSSGMTYPCIMAVWSKWAPKVERSRMLTTGFSGDYIGNAIAILMSSILSYTYGWSAIFYITGAFGLVWYAAWWYFIFDNPGHDKWISEQELKLLESSLGIENSNKSASLCWKELIASIPVWALSAAHFCENWGFYTFVTKLERLMKETREYDLETSNHFLCSTFLLMSCAMLSAGRLSDWLCKSKTMSTTNIRKLFICSGFTLQALFTLLSTCSVTTAKTEICIALVMGLGSFVSAAINGNHLDLGIEHASVLMGITNTFATLPVILSPILTEYITTNKTIEEWKLVLNIVTGFYLFGALCYGSFGSETNNTGASDDLLRVYGNGYNIGEKDIDVLFL